VTSTPKVSGVGADSAVRSEHAARAQDRSRVVTARHGGRRWHLVWLLVGPGVLAMLGENDGPSMISYATVGATYGLGFFLPFVVILFVMAYVCQEMCMRVGAVTGRGYGQLVLHRYGALWGWFGAGDLVFTNLITLVSESSRSGSAWPTSTSVPPSPPPWESVWWCSPSAADGTGGGNASCWAWPCSPQPTPVDAHQLHRRVHSDQRHPRRPHLTPAPDRSSAQRGTGITVSGGEHVLHIRH